MKKRSLSVDRDQPRGVASPEPAFEIVDAQDGLDNDERTALHAVLRDSLEQAKRGELIDADKVLAEIASPG